MMVNEQEGKNDDDDDDDGLMEEVVSSSSLIDEDDDALLQTHTDKKSYVEKGPSSGDVPVLGLRRRRCHIGFNSSSSSSSSSSSHRRSTTPSSIIDERQSSLLGSELRRQERKKETTTTTAATTIAAKIKRERLIATTALDKDVANVDYILRRVGKIVILFWIILILISYRIVPDGSIQYYVGKEWNWLFVETLLLTMAVIIKHLPLLWDVHFFGLVSSSSSSSSFESAVGGQTKTNMSGVLFGGLVVQCVAIFTGVIMIIFPVPTMIDPILGSKVNFMRYCEWIPLAGYLTLLTESIDAPELDGEKLSQAWNKKFFVSGMMSLSTCCGLIFPFCTNFYVWLCIMIVSCLTYSIIIIRYFEKRRLFASCVWSGGKSVDEIELYDRARMSLTLHGICSCTWTLITINYFVTSCGHLIAPKSWTFLHDPAAMMVGECTMDFISKGLYMLVIVQGHNAAFDEAKRANRRLAELKNTMSVVWESSSDCIAISMQKASGSTTSMASPSFFRPALIARKEDRMQDITAVILEHSNIASGTLADLSQTGGFPTGIRIVRKDEFTGVDMHSSTNVKESLECLGMDNEVVSSLVASFTEMLIIAWQKTKSTSNEILFEHHDAISDDERMHKRYEIKVSRLEENTIVMVVRDVSERYRRFEAQKRFVYETAAREKDSRANRFTRHEVKNGLLGAIEICGTLREQLTSYSKLGFDSESIIELDSLLHDVLDLILVDTMARDVIHEMYVPHVERINVDSILEQTRSFGANKSQFSYHSIPSPMPVILSDRGLFKCIHGNIVRNALKYGMPGGKITTEAKYDDETGIFEMKIINLPGHNHDKLVELGKRASELVFSHGTRLHDDVQQSHSAGDGAWIIRNCIKILGGTAEIKFEQDRTLFVVQIPVKIYRPSQDIETFHLPSNVWGIGIDDSKIQRKLLKRFFVHAGVQENRQIILGEGSEEMIGFADFVIGLVNSHPCDFFFLLVDENLEIEDSGVSRTISGSESIKQIRAALDPEQELRMLALVRSANDSPKDLALYRSRAHGCMPKIPLRGTSVKETVYQFWNERFPNKSDESVKLEGEAPITRIASTESIRDLNLIAPVELLLEVEEIDSLCVRNPNNSPQFHPELWDKLHRLKGDLKTVNVDGSFTLTIDLIDALRNETQPADFMDVWLKIRSDIVSYVISQTSTE